MQGEFNVRKYPIYRAAFLCCASTRSFFPIDITVDHGSDRRIFVPDAPGLW